MTYCISFFFLSVLVHILYQPASELPSLLPAVLSLMRAARIFRNAKIAVATARSALFASSDEDER